jgi:hypothetical protein
MEKLSVVGNGMAGVACAGTETTANALLYAARAICPGDEPPIEVAAVGISIRAATR